MKSLVLSVVIGLLAAQIVSATPQVNDVIHVGGHTYGIFQFPMSGYWHLEGKAPGGRVPLPEFEVTSSANWRGYVAEWSIARRKLYLVSVKGQIDGRQVHNRQIIEKRFPVHARWYTGSIFVSVGDFNAATGTFDYVLEFRIKKGDVVATAYHETLSIPMTWNGLLDSRPSPANSRRESKSVSK